MVLDLLTLSRKVSKTEPNERVLLSDERLLQTGKEAETQVIDKCSVALNHLVELHYDKRHLLDVIRRQQEEIDWTRNKIRDSGTLIQHLESVKVSQISSFEKKSSMLTRALTKTASKNRPIIVTQHATRMSRLNS